MRRALAVAMAVVAVLAPACADDATPDEESQGMEVVLDRAEDIAEGEGPEQRIVCATQQRMLRAAVEAYRLQTGDLEAEPTVEDLDRAGLLDPEADIAYEISEYADAAPQLQAMVGGPCEGVG